MKRFLTIVFIFASTIVMAHPMPNSIIELSVAGNEIMGVAKMPVSELESAIMPQHGKINDKAFLKEYFAQHIVAQTWQKMWRVHINDITFRESTDAFVGKYKEVAVQFVLTPPKGTNTRNFTLKYNAIVHQVVTHKVLVFLKQDWQNGVYNEDAEKTQTDENLIGSIQTDIPTGKVRPLEVSLKEGSNTEGFKTMIKLGMHHISEGTDHLLFLLVLLLTAPLTIVGKKWGQNKGFKQSLKKILTITFAFTIGHSITLALATLGWVKLPSGPIEIIIAFSILVTAVHAIKPLFPHRESLVTGSFGLIHGLAFATILTGFNLTGKPLLLSLVGFNLGIELMQLIVIVITVPWLIILSRYNVYKYIRITGAVFALMAASAWMTERISGNSNLITHYLNLLPHYGKYGVLILVIITVIVRFRKTQPFKV
ncbi:HupE/UreJ family protein [Flavobacterium sp. RHBU_3]|uniref:HupE/UreJ family protein n=1 Tax=Flavobacterium sp. RHBU_3 TaxID=3391184 RepID=UPI0039850B2D